MTEKNDLYDEDYTGSGEKLVPDRKKVFLKQKDGENIYRIIPPLKAWADFPAFKGKPSAFFHAQKHAYSHPENDKGFVVYICPKWASGGARHCEDCDESFELRKTGDEADEQVAKSMSAKHVVLCNVVDRDGDDDQAMVLELSAPITEKYAKGKTKFEMLQKIMDNKRNPMNVIHPVTGHDIILEKSGKGQFGTSYSMEADPKPSRLHENDEVMMKLIAEQHDLREFVKAPSDEVIASMKERARTFGQNAKRRKNERDQDDDDGEESGIQKQVDEIAGDDDGEDLAF